MSSPVTSQSQVPPDVSVHGDAVVCEFIFKRVVRIFHSVFMRQYYLPYRLIYTYLFSV